MSSEPFPRLGFLGPHLGRYPGWVTTQSEVLVELFSEAGYTVHQASNHRFPVARAIDMTWALWRWRSQVDVVSISVFSGRAFALAELNSKMASRLRIPQIQVLHGGDLPQMVGEDADRVRRTFARADAIVAPSAFLAETARSLGFEVEVIANVLDPADYRYRHRTELQRPLRLLFMRTFHTIYRPMLALDALAELRRRGIEARLTLAGQDKGLLGACRQRAETLGLADAVSFPGFLDAEAKRRVFDDHDVFLSTNSVDNTPVSVLEAAASGLPIVAVAAGGLAALLDGGTYGRLVDELAEGEAEEALAGRLADAVEGLLAAPETVDRLSTAGRQLAERSAWPRVEQQWLRLFERLCSGAR